jgi:hypothetical protein
MVEIEISVLASQCLDRRIESRMKLAAETVAWEQQRNAARARIKWMFKPTKPAPRWVEPIQSQGSNQPQIKESKPLCSGTSL